MNISALSSGNLASVYSAPAVQVQQPAKAPQQAPKTDTVSLSPQAQQLASDGDPSALEAQESSTEKLREAQKGKA